MVKIKSDSLFKYLNTSGSTSFISTNGCTQRSARLQTDLATCRLADVFPPPGKMKFSSGGKLAEYSSIHSSNSAVCLLFRAGIRSMWDFRAEDVGVARQEPISNKNISLLSKFLPQRVGFSNLDGI